MYLLKCLYQATKVSQRRHVFVKVPVPSQESETSCVSVRGIDFVTRSLVLCVCFVDHCLFFCSSSFGHCFVCSIYGFWLLLWYLQTLSTMFLLHRFWTAPTVWYFFVFHFNSNVFCCCVCVCVFGFKKQWWDFMHLLYSF